MADVDGCVREEHLHGLGLDSTVVTDLVRLLQQEKIKLADLSTMTRDDFRAMGLQMGIIVALRKRFQPGSDSPSQRIASPVTKSVITTIGEERPGAEMSVNMEVSQESATQDDSTKVWPARVKDHLWASPDLSADYWQPDCPKTLLFNLTNRAGAPRPEMKWYGAQNEPIYLPHGTGHPNLAAAACELSYSRLGTDDSVITIRVPYGELPPAQAASFASILALADIFYLPLCLPPNYGQQYLHSEVAMFYKLSSHDLKTAVNSLADLECPQRSGFEFAYLRAELVIDLARRFRLNQFVPYLFSPPRRLNKNTAPVQRNMNLPLPSAAHYAFAPPAPYQYSSGYSYGATQQSMTGHYTPSSSLPGSQASSATTIDLSGASYDDTWASPSQPAGHFTSPMASQAIRPYVYGEPMGQKVVDPAPQYGKDTGTKSQIEKMLIDIVDAKENDEAPFEAFASYWKTQYPTYMVRLLVETTPRGWPVLRHFFMCQTAKAESVERLLAFFAQGISALDATVHFEVLSMFESTFIAHLHSIIAWCNSFAERNVLSTNCLQGAAHLVCMLSTNLPFAVETIAGKPCYRFKSERDTNGLSLAAPVELPLRTILVADRQAAFKSIDVFKTCQQLKICNQALQELQHLISSSHP